MPKTIKFNLICDDKPVRTVEDLQNNFSIEDVMAYYNNKLLHRWLEVRGYHEELEKMNAIIVKKPVEIIKELIKIFAVACDDKEIEESIYMLEYLDERRTLFSEYNKQNYKAKQIIEDYEAGYRQLVDGIIENPNDTAKIKANIEEIVSNYAWVLELDHRRLFYLLMKKSALAIMCLLMNEKSRNYFLPVKKKNAEGRDYLDTVSNTDKAFMFETLCGMITNADFLKELGHNLKSYAGITDGYWKDLEPKGKKYMVVSMGSGDYVRSAGLPGGDLGYNDVTKEFVILDGIDYKSNSSNHRLMYLEV